MKIRKINYIISYTHIFTFSSEYRRRVAPFFSGPTLRYAVDNMGTFEERIRLLFDSDGFAMMCNKDSIILTFEGDIAGLKKSSAPAVAAVFDLFAAIKQIEGFGRVLWHQIQLFAVSEKKPVEIENISDSRVVRIGPTKKLKEFSVIYEWDYDAQTSNRIELGNFKASDIKKYDLSPFNTPYNKELESIVGYLCNATTKETTDSVSFSKFKDLLDSGENLTKKVEAWI